MATDDRMERQLDAVLPLVGYHCLHDCRLRDSAEASGIDHVLIGPVGSFVVADEFLSGEVRSGTDGRVWCGGHPIEGQIDKVRSQAASVSQVINSQVSAVMAIHGAEVKTRPVVRGVHVAAAAEVPALIQRRAPYRSPAQVGNLAARARAGLSCQKWTTPIVPQRRSDGRPRV